MLEASRRQGVSLRTFKGGDSTPTKREPELLVLSPQDRKRIAELESQAQQLEKRLAVAGEKAESGKRKAESGEQPRGTPEKDDSGAGLAPGEEVELQKQLDALRREIEMLGKRRRRAMVTEAIAPRTTRILSRGDWMDESGEVVEPAVPRFLKPLDVADRRVTHSIWPAG